MFRIKQTFKFLTPKNSVRLNMEQNLICKIVSLLETIISEADTKDKKILKNIANFKKQNPLDQSDNFPTFYIKTQDFILEKQSHKFKNKATFKNFVSDSITDIQKIPSLNLLFLVKEKQEILLVELFLRDVLIALKNLCGKIQDPRLLEIVDELNDLNLIDNDKHNIVSISFLKKLFNQSIYIQVKIEECLGNNLMLSLYNKVYNSYFKKYHLLEAFNITINIIPEGLINEENTNYPSKVQLHKLLLNQINNLENINSLLNDEIVAKIEAQKELEENQKLYATILNSSLNANVIFKPDGSLIRTNGIAESLLNILPDTENHSYNLFNLIPEQVSEEVQEHLKHCAMNETPTESKVFEFQKLDDSKETKYYLMKVCAINTDCDTLLYSIINDVTEDKRAQEIKKELEIAEKSASNKTQFLSNISHEIRTPLNVIMGLTDLFNKTEFCGSENEFKNIEGIRFSAESLLILVDDILDYGKMDSDKIIINKSDFDLFNLIEKIKFGIDLKSKEKGLDFTIEMGPNIPKYVKGDPYRISQILNNLLGNAVKFTSSGYIILKIQLISKDNTNLHLKFEVEDSGRGIDEKHISKVFDSFYQVPDHQLKPTGTGLGLSISKKIVENLNGKISMESTIDKGTKFVVILPFLVSTVNCPDNIITQEEDSTKSLKNKKILVAEDNKLNQLVLKQILEKFEAEVIIANNGQEALDILDNHSFDLIFMDIHMPILNGLEATKIIRERFSIQQKPQIPIVACSADVFPESRKKAKDSGLDYYITKPINKKIIEEILNIFSEQPA